MIISGSSRLLRAAARSSCAACTPAAAQQQCRSAHKLVAVQLTSDSLPALGSRNQIVALSPGLARNRLIPAGLAIYVGRDGQGVSVRRDMERRARRREAEQGLQSAKLAEMRRERQAKGVLEGLGGKTMEDPLEPARAAERALQSSLAALVPASVPLVFHRLTTSPTSSDLFGSVSIADVLSGLRDRGLSQGQHVVASGESAPAGTGVGAFAPGQPGVQNGRVKQLGEFCFEVGAPDVGGKGGGAGRGS